MKKALPKILTRRVAAHLTIARLQQWLIKVQGWQDVRAALKARKSTLSDDR